MTYPISQLVDQAFQRFSRQTALICPQPSGDVETTTFMALKEAAGKVSGLLADLNREECIGIYMQRSLEHVACVVAGLYSTSPYTTINHLVSSRQIAHLAKDSNLKLLLCDNATLLKLRALTQDEEEGHATLSSMRIVHLYRGDKLPPVHAQTIALLSNFTKIVSVRLNDLEVNELSVPDADLVNPAKLILFTSGSTGNPKGVMISGDDLVTRIASESKAYELQQGDVLLNMLPFSFDVGCNQLLSALTQGCSLVLLNSWMPKDIVSAIIQHKVVGVSGVPSLWLSVIDSDAEALAKVDASLRYITISGGDMAEKDRLTLRSILPSVNIFKTYGQTETFRTAMLMPEYFDEKHQSVGKPVDGVQVLILDEDDQPLGPGKKGQVIHQGAGTMLGYIGDAEASKKKLGSLPALESSVVFTGDLGSLDEDGFLYLHGRQDKMFKVRGNRVYPEEIEKELCNHEQILEAASAFDKDKEAISVFVRKKQGADMTEKDVLKFLSTRLPSYMLPSQCLLYDDFPRTASGKVDVPALTVQIN